MASYFQSAVILIPSVKCADYLRVSLARVRKILPTARIVLVTTADDSESIAIGNVMRCFQIVTVAADVPRKNGSKYNFAALVRAGQMRIQEKCGPNVWTLLMRPQVLLDESLASVDLNTLDKTAVYSAFFHSLPSGSDVQKYQSEEPTPEEVRLFTPSSSFLLFYGSTNKFGTSSNDTKSAERDFIDRYVGQFMIQTKLGYLGTLFENDDGRVSSRWDEKKPRIEPVHTGAVENAEKLAEIAQKKAALEKEAELQRKTLLEQQQQQTKEQTEKPLQKDDHKIPEVISKPIAADDAHEQKQQQKNRRKPFAPLELTSEENARNEIINQQRIVSENDGSRGRPEVDSQQERSASSNVEVPNINRSNIKKKNPFSAKLDELS